MLTGTDDPVEFVLPVGKSVWFQSSNGRWWRFDNDGSSLGVGSGTGTPEDSHGDPAGESAAGSGPECDALDEIVANGGG